MERKLSKNSFFNALAYRIVELAKQMRWEACSYWVKDLKSVSKSHADLCNKYMYYYGFDIMCMDYLQKDFGRNRTVLSVRHKALTYFLKRLLDSGDWNFDLFRYICICLVAYILRELEFARESIRLADKKVPDDLSDMILDYMEIRDECPDICMAMINHFHDLIKDKYPDIQFPKHPDNHRIKSISLCNWDRINNFVVNVFRKYWSEHPAIDEFLYRFRKFR